MGGFCVELMGKREGIRDEIYVELMKKLVRKWVRAVDVQPTRKVDEETSRKLMWKLMRN